jgi:hypothetical protein
MEMYSLIEIEKLMRDRDRFKREWYNANLTLSRIRRNSPELFLEAKEKQGREKETVEMLLDYLKKGLPPSHNKSRGQNEVGITQ